MDDTTIRVENVSKKFCKTLKSSMFYGISDITKNLIGRSSGSHKLREREFWALDNVSFELKKGEILGIIGPNGSGKSTLLKMLNGIFWPDKGKISVAGRVGALIEIGAGFHPMLTGRENIYVNGAILGMSKNEVNSKFEEIVRFADIGDFIDTPVKNYSSGMFVRLGFSIAVHSEPDVLLIDEILAVGDVGFRARCYNAIAKISNNAALIFISHSMSQIARICSKVMVLNNGKTLFLGDTSKGIEVYNSLFHNENSILAGSRRATIHQLKFLNKSGHEIQEIKYNEDLTIELSMTITEKIPNFIVFVGFYDQYERCVAECNSIYSCGLIKNKGEVIDIKILVSSIILNPDTYKITCLIYDEKMQEHVAWYFNNWELKVTGDFVGQNSIQFPALWDIDYKK